MVKINREGLGETHQTVPKKRGRARSVCFPGRVNPPPGVTPTQVKRVLTWQRHLPLRWLQLDAGDHHPTVCRPPPGTGRAEAVKL